MYVLRKLQPHKYLHALGVVLIGCFYSLQVAAQVTIETASNGQRTINFPANTIGGSPTSYAYTPNSASYPVSQPLPVSPASPSNLSGWHAAGNYGVTPSATGATVGSTVNAPVGGGKSVPVNVRAPVSGAQAAKAIGRFAGKVVGVLAVGNALYDLGKELGFTLDNSSGSMVVTSNPPNTSVNDGNAGQSYYCDGYQFPGQVIYWSQADVTGQIVPAFGTPPQGWTGRGACNQMPYEVLQVPPYTVRYPTLWVRSGNFIASNSPSSLQEFEDAIAAKSGWPTSSALARTLAESLKSGESVQVGTPTVSGPPSVPGPSSTTVTPAQNGQPQTTTTTNTTHNVTYAGNTYNTSTVTTTTVNNSTTITTTTETKDPEPLPDPCKERPNSNECREDEFDTPEGEVPKRDVNITFAPEDLGFGGGTCPADKFITPHGMSTPIKLVNWVDNCEKITTYARPMILALATFAALMIIFVGGKTE